MVLKKTGEINNLISQLRFPPPKTSFPQHNSKTKPNKTKIKTNKKKEKKTKTKTMLIVLAVFTNASNFLRFGVVYFALLVDARVEVTF